MSKKFIFLASAMLLTSCVGQMTNNIDAQIKASTTVNANLDTQIKTGNISTNQTASPVPTLPPVQNTTDIIPQSIQFNESDKIYTDTSGYFNSVVFYNNGLKDNQAVYSSSNQDVLSLSGDGKYSALKEGEVTVTIKSKINPNVIQNILVKIINKSSSNQPSPTIIPVPATDVREKGILKGTVCDINGFPVSGASVVARSLESGIAFQGEPQQTINGFYIFRNVPFGTRLEVTVSKPGWTTRTQSIVLKDIFGDDPNANVLNFGEDITSTNGNKTGSDVYAIQDEPEISMLKINGRVVESAANNDKFINGNPLYIKPTPEQMANTQQLPGIGNFPSLTNVSSEELNIEMTFSEPVNKEDVERNFKVTSQQQFDNLYSSFIIDSTYKDVNFTWSADEKTVTFKTNKAILTNKSNTEAKYLIDFSNPFRDRKNTSSLKNRAFRFSTFQLNDFAVFSVKSDKEAPSLKSVIASDGSTEDRLILTFDKSMNVINKASNVVIINSNTKGLIYRNANNIVKTLLSVPGKSDNNALIIGYEENNNFKAVYMVGRISRQDLSSPTNSSIKLTTLGNYNDIDFKDINSESLIKEVTYNNNTIEFKLDTTSFDTGDNIIVSVGRPISGQISTSNTSSVSDDLSVITTGNIQYDQIYDPAGNLMDNTELQTLGRISISNSQKAAPVN